MSARRRSRFARRPSARRGRAGGRPTAAWLALLTALAAAAVIVLPWRSLAAQERRREPRGWMPRFRLTPTLATTRGTVRSTGGFGLQLGAEWGRDEGLLAVPGVVEAAGDDRRQVGCLTDCAQGRMSAWLLTSGLVLRPVPRWPLRPYVEGTVSGGFAQWSNAVLPAGLGANVGFLVGGRTGGGVTTRASVGAGLEWGREDRWFVAGVQRGLVHEARWSPSRLVTTVVVGIRART
ncbi:MAG: hypothetical protein ACK53W_17745 [Gemmatimonadota bacterium]